MTLKFLGEIDDEKLNQVQDRLSKIKFDKFDVSLGDLGVFSEEFIRIIWVELKGNWLFELQKSIDETLEGIFEKEKRFMAHITIARPKLIENKSKFLKELAKINVKNNEFKVESFFLKESKLLPNRPEYYDIIEIKAKSGKYNQERNRHFI